MDTPSWAEYRGTCPGLEGFVHILYLSRDRFYYTMPRGGTEEGLNHFTVDVWETFGWTIYPLAVDLENK